MMITNDYQEKMSDLQQYYHRKLNTQSILQRFDYIITNRDATSQKVSFVIDSYLNVPNVTLTDSFKANRLEEAFYLQERYSSIVSTILVPPQSSFRCSVIFPKEVRIDGTFYPRNTTEIWEFTHLKNVKFPEEGRLENMSRLPVRLEIEENLRLPSFKTSFPPFKLPSIGEAFSFESIR